MKYDVDYFIEKFEAIPEEKWIKGGTYDFAGTGNHCVLGHCGIKNMHDKVRLNDEQKALFKIFGASTNYMYKGRNMGPNWSKVYEVNDKGTSKLSAKKNVIEFLKSVKHKQATLEVV